MSANDPKDPTAVSADDVREFLRTRRNQFNAKKNLAEVHGQTKVEFVESTGFNKSALAFAERLDRLSPEVRSDVLRSLDLIRASMDGIWAQESTAELFPEASPEEQKEANKRKRDEAKRAKAHEHQEAAEVQPFELDDVKQFAPAGDFPAPPAAEAKDRKQEIKDELAAMRDRKAQQAADIA